jgi:hypothetical protein
MNAPKTKMMPGKVVDASSQGKRAAYVQPQLRSYGSLRALTLGTSGTQNGDSMAMAMV